MEASFLSTHYRISAAHPVSHNKIRRVSPAQGSFFPRLGLQSKTDPAARCVAPSGGLVANVEKELAAEEEEMRRWVEKCGCRGVVELLECLEKEAIMGEDEGKEPNDYSRRARIFERSSRLFQALREADDRRPAPSSRPS